MYVSVKIESFRSRPGTIAQCYRCQRFGHSSLNCGHPARCVKCSGDHSADECPRERHSAISQPKCCNCNGVHTANYGGCPSHKTAVTRQKLSKKVQPSKQAAVQKAQKASPATAGNATRAQPSTSAPQQVSQVQTATSQGPTRVVMGKVAGNVKRKKPVTKLTPTPTGKTLTKKSLPKQGMPQFTPEDFPSLPATRPNRPAGPKRVPERKENTSPFNTILSFLMDPNILSWLQQILSKLAAAKSTGEFIAVLVHAITSFMSR
jgi:hypothetical protein